MVATTSADRDIAEFIEEHIGEFGDYEITADEIMARSPVFERFEHGFAVILKPDTCDMELWFLYVDPEHRGRRLGREYVRRIQKKFPTYYMTLHCHKRLRPFYGSLGFTVTNREGDYRRMRG